MVSLDDSKGSIFGGALLIAGCCIGAGMLGLPVVTKAAGFIPSFFIFIFSWAFMTVSALLLLEVAQHFSQDTNISEMAKRYLGPIGQAASFILMLFLMYALMTAYSVGGGQLLAGFSAGLLSANGGSLLLGSVIFLSLMLGTKALDYTNRIFMAGLFATYVILVVIGLPEVNVENLTYKNWHEALFVSPIMIVSFGFNNLIPSFTKYFDMNIKKIRLSILIGSLIPLGIYLLWQLLILGLITPEANVSETAQMATQLLEDAAPALPYVILFVESFAFFAIITSFIAQALSILDFYMDQAGDQKSVLTRFMLVALTVLPPLAIGMTDPELFLKALSLAGSFAAIILFVLIPVFMAYKSRRLEKKGSYTVFGGSATLAVLTFVSFFIMIISNYHYFLPG